ncbi:hypothetical protein ACJX0J_022332, partial [Zea mays]
MSDLNSYFQITLKKAWKTQGIFLLNDSLVNLNKLFASVAWHGLHEFMQLIITNSNLLLSQKQQIYNGYLFLGSVLMLCAFGAVQQRGISIAGPCSEADVQHNKMPGTNKRDLFALSLVGALQYLTSTRPDISYD